MASYRNAAFALVAAGLLAFALDALLFRAGAYRPLLDPNSSAGAYERTVSRVERALRTHPGTVIVLGDSRIADGFDAAAAERVAHRPFVNAAVPGTTPRCWRFFIRRMQPLLPRAGAIVIPVDTYTDDDGALGAVDAWDHIEDLRYVVFDLRPADTAWFARSVHYRPNRRKAIAEMLLPGRIVAADVQALLRDPLGRVRALAEAAPDAYPGREGLRTSLAGLRRAGSALVMPPGLPANERAAIAANVQHVARPDPSYGEYRRFALASVIEAARAAHVPVVFVRIPTRPLPAAGTAASRPRDSLAAFAAHPGVRALDAAPYLALERPDLFGDEHHLNVVGRGRFSARLAADLAR